MAVTEKDLAIRDDVVVEAEIDGEHAKLAAFVTNVLPETLWLALRLPDPRFFRLETGHSVHLTFIRDGAAVVAESTFIRRLGGERLGTEKSRVMAVARPQGIEAAERRMHVRVDLERRVYIRMPAASGPGTGRVGIGRTVNVSAGGLQMDTELPLMVGDRITIVLALRANDLVTTAAQVVRIEEAPAVEGDRPRSRIAVRFERMPEADQERIACHILAERRRQRKHLSHAGQTAAPRPTVSPDSASPDPSVGELEVRK